MSLRRRKLTIFGALALVVIARSLSFAENEAPSTRNQGRSQVSRSRFPSIFEIQRVNDTLPSVDDRFQTPPKSAKGRNASLRLVAGESDDYFGELRPGHSEPAESNFLSDTEQPLFQMEEQGVSIAPEAPLMEPGCDCCEPLFERILAPNRRCQDCKGVENWSPLVRHLGFSGTCCGEPGIGHERVVFAPFIMDPTQPQNYTMMRWDSGFGLHTPDRSEFFWSKPGKGPAISPDQINFQDMIYVNETGSSAFSVMTEIPVRFIETDYGSTSGMGDMKVATKARLINGKNWQITQIFRTYINTGSTTKGVGAGHVSLEPGILARYELRPDTYVHGEVKFLVPIAATTGFASNILTYGVGVSHVLYETDHFAIIPNLEMVNYDFLSGQKTIGNTSLSPGQIVNANNDLAINVIPGARFVFGPRGDLGLFEFGISNLIGLGDRYVNDMLRLEFKFTH
jgi:hypothetical protein